MLKHLLTLIFLVRVIMPTQARLYDNVIIWSIFHDNVYRLCLANGTQVYVPVMFTIIEEKK